MRRLLIAAVVLAVAGGVWAEEKKGKCHAEGGKETCKRRGLVAHYYRDPANWGGNWTPGSKPQVDPADWTFTKYHHSRIEPLVNHLFIRRGWFSVRWKGLIEIPKGEGAVNVTFEIWADDGCRLFIDGEKVIDDWKDVDEDATDSHRTATVSLTGGKHKIVVEYFQGESLREDDRDPAKLYWSIPERHVPKQIVPASAFSYTLDDLFPDPGREDKEGAAFIEDIIEKIKSKAHTKDKDDEN